MTAKRGSDWIWGLAVVVVAMVMAVWDVTNTVANRRAETWQRLDALARVVEARTSQALGGIDSLLRDAQSEMDRVGEPGAVEFQRYLITRARFQPHALTISVVTPKGTVLQSTEEKLIGITVGERSYQRYFRDHPQSQSLFIGEPITAALNRTVIFATRAHRDAQGKVSALMVAALSPSLFFGIIEAALPSEPSGAISISNQDHIILARAPNLDGTLVGKSLANAPLRIAHVASGQPITLQEGAGGLDGNVRMIVMRTNPDWGIVIGVSVTRADVMRPILPHMAGDALFVILVAAASFGIVKFRRYREQTQLQAAGQVARARDYYMQVLDEIPTLVRRQAVDGACLYVNDAWSCFTGRSPNDDMGDGWLEAVHPDDRPALKIAGEHDYRLARAEGGYGWIHEVTRPLRDQDGQLVGLLASGIDVTLSRRFQEDLQQSNAELEEFAYVASHDLREPLRMVNSYMGLIERRLGDQVSTEIREFIDFARDGANRMDKLILDLLQYSRIGRMSAPKSMVDLNQSLDHARDLLHLAMAEQHASIQAEHLPSVFASEDDMVRLFQNLIANAIKYAQPGIAPVVTIAAQRQIGAWCISVSDNGIGINRDFFDRIFRIFQRLHGRDEHGGGSGIGLSICKKIVESHGGRIWVDSPGPNQGSVFSFTLPA